MNYIEFVQEMKQKGYQKSAAIELMIRVIKSKHQSYKIANYWIHNTNNIDFQNSMILRAAQLSVEKDDLIKRALLIANFEKSFGLRFIEDKDQLIELIFKRKNQKEYAIVAELFRIAQLLIEYVTELQKRYF